MIRGSRVRSKSCSICGVGGPSSRRSSAYSRASCWLASSSRLSKQVKRGLTNIVVIQGSRQDSGQVGVADASQRSRIASCLTDCVGRLRFPLRQTARGTPTTVVSDAGRGCGRDRRRSLAEAGRAISSTCHGRRRVSNPPDTRRRWSPSSHPLPSALVLNASIASEEPLISQCDQGAALQKPVLPRRPAPAATTDSGGTTPLRH